MAAGCGTSDSSSQSTGSPSSQAPPKDAAVPPDAFVELFVYPAVRCAECHGKMHGEWKTSAHARADSSPRYRLMREALGDKDCGLACHSPLRRYAPARPHAEEGVSCEVCHTIKAVDVGAGPGALQLQLHDMVRYGPLCDAKQHYFHRMGCSELHRTSELCAPCHELEHQVPDGPRIAVLKSYAEWKAGPYAAENRSCQSCHMPGVRAEAASGSPPRDGVPDHSFLGHGGNLRTKALALAARATAAASGGIEVAVDLSNVGSGHFVPTGLPARRVVLRAALVDASGAELAAQTRSYGRTLVDASGAEVPFFFSVKQAQDNRIGPRQTRSESFVFDGHKDAGTIRLEVSWYAMSSAIARRVGAPEPGGEVIVRADIPFGPARAGGRRSKLPKRIRAGAKK